MACIRKICVEQAELLGREELEETRIGRLKHKIEKLIAIGEKIPGVEFLRTDAFSGEGGITLTEYAPFGVIGVITPVTHSLPTLACNAINMLAAGNALVCNPHPGPPTPDGTLRSQTLPREPYTSVAFRSGHINSVRPPSSR